ncbi:MAG: phosphoesterase, PA-phosphatase related protein [Tardiphaga sp.]|nr:phosphoesterase, PA-phosphatase related protein [Tardiphaga sp.]
MKRTGLMIALGLALVIGLVFGLYPQFDLRIAALFYDPTARDFPLRHNVAAMIARDAAMWVAWGIAAPAIVALVAKMIRPDRPLFLPGRAVALLLISITLSAGILTNLTFKSHWGRPRPIATQEFGGPWPFKAWWDPRGACPKNCSFFSGESATAFWAYAPAALAPPPWRPLAYAGATVFGVVTSVLRMAFGGHYFTDVTIAGIISFLVIWLLYGWLYRWRATRMSDQRIDDALTRFGWPGYRWRRKLGGHDVGPVPTATNRASR